MGEALSHWPAKLVAIANKPKRTIVGLMSGTSLDGLDIAVCDIKGAGKNTQLSVRHSKTISYSKRLKAKLKANFAQSQVNMLELCLLNAELGTLHGNWVTESLKEWSIKATEIDLVASHGQTLFHAPQRYHGLKQRPNASIQIGDGDHVAAACGIITLADFRQRHIAQGGEGAPLVLYGDKLLFSSTTASRLLVNLGGISNFTWLPKAHNAEAFATDSGPANTLLDAYCQAYLAIPYDEKGAIAQTGKVNVNLLSSLLEHDFFAQDLPKTTGPESFNLAFFEQAKVNAKCNQLRHDDALATILAFTVAALHSTVLKAGIKNSIDEVYMSGGGTKNPILMQAIAEAFAPLPVNNIDELGISADEKEAALFALLANECIANGDAWGNDSAILPTSMGKICFPS